MNRDSGTASVNGGADEGELLSADAGGRKARGVFDAAGGGGGEGREQAFVLLVQFDSY